MAATKTLTTAQITEIADSLSGVPELRVPARLSQQQASQQERQQYLTALLQHDPGVFLERHRNQLITPEQRSYFEPLREDDYEVDFYLKMLEAEAGKRKEGSGSVSSTVKNRRLAKMNRLEKEGFFDEEAARKRAPLLHHQYLGQYSKPRQPGAGANTLHDRIIQQHEELQLLSTMAMQKRQEDAAGQALEAELSESEEEEDSETELDADAEAVAAKPDAAAPVPISLEELDQNRQDFHAIMQARFLEGQDGGAEADTDASLDDDWAKEQTQDIEDKYFET